MKRKMIIAALVAAVMALGVFSAFALDYEVPENAQTVTSRFFALDPDVLEDEFTMVSEDGEMTIHITNDVLIYFEDYVPMSDECDAMTQMVREVLFGRTLAEVLHGRNMHVVFEEADYIVPVSIKILFEGFVTGPLELEPGDLEGFVIEGEVELDEIEMRRTIEALTLIGEIVVNNEMLENPPVPFIYSTEEAVAIMVPLRVVAEALGYDVGWNGELMSVQLGVGIHLWIDSTEVHLGRMAPIELPMAVMLVDGVTFVPIELFRDVLGMYAYVFEGQVIVEAETDMF